ncbi:MAG TPA: hypothetical protein VMT64_16760 [Candidatus Binataceae bacterium]|nr:hypothetical protein [Candidatus Binataceae bacterium]
MKVERSAPIAPEISIERNPAVIEFARRVSAIEGVRCVIAEPEDGAIHLTTFATPLSDKIVDAIIAVEATLIDDFPPLLFDFHIFDAARHFGERAESIPGECFVWGDLSADQHRAPQTSKR